MPATVIRHGEAAREALLRGIDLVADAVGRTLGPMGRHAVLERSEAPPLVTNDGVTIARSIERLSEPLSNQGVHLLREVADTTEDAVGDGTTTSILLARAIVREGARQLASGADPAALGRGIAAATREAQEHVRAEGRPLASHDELVRVAAVSSRDERIGELVAAAVARVGPDGVVRVQDDTAYGIRMELRDGMRFAGGLLSRGLATDANGREASFERPYVLAASERITQVRQLVPLLSAVVEQRAPLLIVADEVSGDALALLVLNVAKRRVPAIAVKAPEFGPDRAAALLDLAILTGGELLGPELGVSAASGRLEHLGRADRVVATLEECTLFGGDGAPAAVAQRRRAIEVELARLESAYERDKRRVRLARLQGTLALLHVGFDTEAEQEETRHRVQDAVHAARAALRDGIVAGGGAALLRAAAAIGPGEADDDERLGRAILRRALEAPLRQLAVNAALDPSVAVARVRAAPPGHGLDVAGGELADLMATGVCDAVGVVCTTLEIAASTARTCLLTEAMVVERPLVVSRRGGGHGHHHHDHDHGHGHGHSHGGARAHDLGAQEAGPHEHGHDRVGA